MNAGRVALLDASVLVALFDLDHIHNEAAHRWFEQNRTAGWATCPITENAFLRVLSGRGYADSDYWRPVSELRLLLQELCESGNHHFWPDSVSVFDSVFDYRAVTSSQTTDVYLLGLAVANGGCLATLDTRIRASAVPSGGLEALVVISPET